MLVRLGVCLNAFHLNLRHVKRLLPEVQNTLPAFNMLSSSKTLIQKMLNSWTVKIIQPNTSGTIK